ncbi:MAG TPA: DUF1287 domain-containing protein [Candidatus Angelobacter sp.]
MSSRQAFAGLSGLLLVFFLPITLLAQSAASGSDAQQDFLNRLSAAAIERTQHTVRYDPGYVAMSYPGGDVPADAGVCSDEVIRSYRALGIDLQKEVHEDMKKHLTAYPERSRTLDRNIDHRRVANLMVFFKRNGETLRVTRRAGDYAPGDLVTWDLGNGLNHIGMVVDQKSSASGRYMMVHNIGQGPRMEDVLFSWKITGHYRYFGPFPQDVRPEERRR